MRTTPCTSLRPTTMVCIPARRRRSILITRSTDPGRSSTSITSVYACSVPWGALDCPGLPVAPSTISFVGTFVSLVMACVLLFRFFDHARDCRTGGDHRKDIRLWLNYKINDHGSLCLHSLMYGTGHVRAPGDAHSSESVCIGQFGVVGAGDRRFGVVA